MNYKNYIDKLKDYPEWHKINTKAIQKIIDDNHSGSMDVIMSNRWGKTCASLHWDNDGMSYREYHIGKRTIYADTHKIDDFANAFHHYWITGYVVWSREPMRNKK